MAKEDEFCCVPVLYFISGVVRSMLLGARFVIRRPGSGNSTTFVPFNSILGFPAPARRTQLPVSRMSLTMRCLHKSWHLSMFCHCFCCIQGSSVLEWIPAVWSKGGITLWKSAVCHNATQGEQTTIRTHPHNYGQYRVAS